MEVQRELGTGFLEYVYEAALCLNPGKKKLEMKKRIL
jgi:hypothetical protein